MATKIYCDGCDEEISFPKEDNKVQIDFGGGVSTSYDLCADCAKRHMWPRKWIRPPKAGPSRMTNFDHD